MVRNLLIGTAAISAGLLLSQTEPPPRIQSDEYWTAPRGEYASRRQDFVKYSAASAGSNALYAQVSRLGAGKAIDEGPIRSAIQFINGRNDISDFKVTALIRIYQSAKPNLISDVMLQEIRKTLLGFKYWPDEPGDKDLMCSWSENHQILFHSSEYLAGQMFPNDTFSNNGKTGRWHMEHARPRVLRWINTKAKAGFSEWDSSSYYPEDMAALLNLADYALDREVALRAVMLLDVMFFDMAVDSFRGTYGTSHGRAYSGTVLSGRREGTAGIQWIAWGMGTMGSPDNVAAVYLATSPKYRVPATIQAVAQDRPHELINRERQGLTIETAKQLGLRFEDPDDFWLLFDSGKLDTRARAEQTLRVASKFNSHRFDVVIRPYAEAVIGTYKALEEMGIEAEGLERLSMTQVNKITYRTPDYQLSTAQDYHKGKAGFQQHIWQATLGPDNIVFTLNPSVSDKYWVGRYPKSVQYKNLLIAIYKVPSQTPPGPRTIFPPDAGGNGMPSPGPAEELPAGFTIAVFRRANYDEVVEKNGWVFGRKGEGFVALRSQAPVLWTKDKALGGEGLVADGRKNIWICQLGSANRDGPFRVWVDRVATARLTFDGFAVHYNAPGLGEADVSWDEPFTINNKPIALNGYDRFDNPYCHAPWGMERYEIRYRDRVLLLDFATGQRREIVRNRTAK